MERKRRSRRWGYEQVNDQSGNSLSKFLREETGSVMEECSMGCACSCSRNTQGSHRPNGIVQVDLSVPALGARP